MAYTQKNIKNILHVTFDMRIGGTEMVIKNIIEGNNNDSYCMSIFCVEEPLGPWGKDMQSEGVSVNSVARKDGFDASVIKALRKHIKSNDIDILHCHQYTPWVYGTMASIGTGTKVIFTEHGRFYPDFSSWKRRFVNPLLALFTYKITAISKATKQALVDYEFLPDSKIEVIYNGIKGLQKDEHEATLIRAKLNIHPSALVYGTIARLDPIKNHTMMINAFAKTLKTLPKAKLLIVGDGELMDDLTNLVNKLNIQDSVIFTGYIPYPKDHLAVFDIFLLSSLSEGTSMTLLEAMSLEKPCVVTDAGGNKEIIVDGETGFVTDNNNMHQFSDAMVFLGSQQKLINCYGRNAKTRFNDKFNATQMSVNYNKFYGN
jgi:glycosyltransferase involved in cell wall biosynthesis